MWYFDPWLDGQIVQPPLVLRTKVHTALGIGYSQVPDVPRWFLILCLPVSQYRWQLFRTSVLCSGPSCHMTWMGSTLYSVAGMVLCFRLAMSLIEWLGPTVSSSNQKADPGLLVSLANVIWSTEHQTSESNPDTQLSHGGHIIRAQTKAGTRDSGFPCSRD